MRSLRKQLDDLAEQVKRFPSNVSIERTNVASRQLNSLVDQIRHATNISEQDRSDMLRDGGALHDVLVKARYRSLHPTILDPRPRIEREGPTMER